MSRRNGQVSKSELPCPVCPRRNEYGGMLARLGLGKEVFDTKCRGPAKFIIQTASKIGPEGTRIIEATDRLDCPKEYDLPDHEWNIMMLERAAETLNPFPGVEE
jgi:hypothetical protein